MICSLLKDRSSIRFYLSPYTLFIHHRAWLGINHWNEYEQKFSLFFVICIYCIGFVGAFFSIKDEVWSEPEPSVSSKCEKETFFALKIGGKMSTPTSAALGWLISLRSPWRVVTASFFLFLLVLVWKIHLEALVTTAVRITIAWPSLPIHLNAVRESLTYHLN